mgnify:CR=1 FL=1
MKRILLIATGGTIASTEDGNGLSPALTGEELAQSVPEISGLCELDVVQPMNIDSTNMRPSDWMRIRDVIVEGYADHDGFVILHGTDTMSYTAAALSYLIQDSPKPIVLTGSQKPMGNPFTDASTCTRVCSMRSMSIRTMCRLCLVASPLPARAPASSAP